MSPFFIIERYMACIWLVNQNDDCYHKGREGGGQRVMIEITISENDDNDGWPLNITQFSLSRHVVF